MPKKTQPRPTVFETTEPGWNERLSVGFAYTPRYLFRVYDANSRGITSTSVVSSSYWKNYTSSCEKNLFGGRSRFGGMQLYDHLKWRKMRDCDSNLTSWTSSLLFAIQLGLYKHSTRPVSKNENDLSKVFILVIDTTKFPEGTFIRDKEAMGFFRETSDSWTADFEEFYQIRTKSDQNAFYFGEYLSQGRFSVKRKCSQTSLQKLIDNDLLRFCPYFEEKRYWAALASRVVEIRRKHFYATARFQTDERTVGRKAVVMAQACFGDDFALPFALVILGMSPEKNVTPVLFSAIIGMFSGTLLTLLRNPWSADEELDCILPDNLVIDSEDLKEVNDFESLVCDLNRFRRKARATAPTDRV